MKLRSTLFSCLLLLGACREASPVSGPLPQRAYVWQREWTPTVSAAVRDAKVPLVLLGSEIVWREDQPKPVRTTIDWSAQARCALALRVAPQSRVLSDAEVNAVCGEALHLLGEARAHGVTCTELQLDFDSAQKKLGAYARWARTVRATISPMRFVITTLPAWLNEPEFKTLITVADAYVLQVHSIPPAQPAARAFVCEPERARRWVTQAARLGRPFEVALSTYSAVVGYDDAGRLRGVALDAVPPNWPAGTRLMQLDSDAEALSKLVNEWRIARPAELLGVIWYRLPVASDQRNWRARTFDAVLEGRALKHELSVSFTDAAPTDFSLVNEGDVDEDFSGQVLVHWHGEAPVATDALRGWTVRLGEGTAEFARAQSLRLPPGGKRDMGWLRFNQRASLHVEIIR